MVLPLQNKSFYIRMVSVSYLFNKTNEQKMNALLTDILYLADTRAFPEGVKTFTCNGYFTFFNYFFFL